MQSPGHRGARVRAWARRAAELHRELAAIAEIDARWWLLAGGAAVVETWPRPDTYLACDAEPDADTFMGYRAPRPRDLVADAIARAGAVVGPDAVRLRLDRRRAARDRAPRAPPGMVRARRALARPGARRRRRRGVDLSPGRRRLRPRPARRADRRARRGRAGEQRPRVAHAGPGAGGSAAGDRLARARVPDAARDPARLRARSHPASPRRPARGEVLADLPDPGRARPQGRSAASAPAHRGGDHEPAVRQRRAR